MKRKWILAVLCGFLLCTSFQLNALVLKFTEPKEKYDVKLLLDADKMRDYQLNRLVYMNVPPEFIEEFLEYTNNHRDLIPVLLGIARLESHNWERMESDNTNSNGSIDCGPLGLNSYNIDDPTFMDAFAPKKYYSDKNVVYMITSINYFIALFNKYNYDAIYMYNCGTKRVLRDEVPQATYYYYNRILSYTYEYESEMDSYKNEVISYFKENNKPKLNNTDSFIYRFEVLFEELALGESSIKHFSTPDYIKNDDFELPENVDVIDSENGDDSIRLLKMCRMFLAINSLS